MAQIAIAIILLIGAGLMVKSFWALMHVAPGFRSESVLTARLSLPRSRYPDNQRIAAFERELGERLHGRPGITVRRVHNVPAAKRFGQRMVVRYRRPTTAAGGDVQHGEVPAGERGLFRDDRDSIAARTIVHVGGYGGVALGQW